VGFYNLPIVLGRLGIWAASGLILAFALQKPIFVWLYGKGKTKRAEVPQQSSKLAVPLPTLKYGLDGLREGISIEPAIAILLAACNKPDTMFITDRGIQPKLEQLRSRLSDPLTSDQAEALRDAVMQKSPFKDVLDWLSGEAIPWLEYQNRKRQREARAKKEREEQIRKNWNWEHAKRLAQQGVRVHIPPEILSRKKEDKDRGPSS